MMMLTPVLLLSLSATPESMPGGIPMTATQPGAAPIERPAIAGRRIIKHFDFDEQALGNYTPLPMLWRRHGDTGFPLFLEGRIDTGIGRSGAPSFQLHLDGGSLGYHYEGRDIAVRTNADYMVVAWIRTEGLETARAYVTACYLDRKGVPIEGTERRSELVGGVPASEWTLVTIPLQNNVPNSRYIGLALWLTQSTVWDKSARPPRHIEGEDVQGQAWFDDITIYRLPRVTLQSSSPGNIFAHDQKIEIRTEVSDPDGLSLTAELTVADAGGREIDRREVPVQPLDQHGFTPLTYDLRAGVYSAELVVRSGSTDLVRRRLRFMRLEPSLRPTQGPSRGFGVIFENTSRAVLAGQRELLKHLNPEYVKLPVWKAQESAAGTAPAFSELDGYIEAVVDAGAQAVATLVNNQRIDQGDPGRKVRSLVEILSDDPAGWRPLIAGTWSRYAGLTHTWQIGADADSSTTLDPRLPAVATSLRTEMTPIVGAAVLASPSDATNPAEPERTSDVESLHVAASLPPETFAEQLLPAMRAHPKHTWLVVQPLAREGYTRELRLGDFARRLVEAWYLGPAGVFIAAPWDCHADALHSAVLPNEDFIIARTVAELIGDAAPVSHMALDGQARCIVFDRGGRAVVFAWDPYAPPEGREHILLLRDDAVQVDLWARRTSLPTIGQQQRVRIGPVPTFILNTPTWLLEFRRQVALEPAVFEATFDVQQQSVCFRNTFHQPISGMLHLVGPEDWDIRPNRMSFVLQPGEEFRQGLSIRFPLNAESGLTPLVGEFSIDADRRYQMLVPAWFELGLRDIDVDTFVYRNGSRVIVRQSMTNRTAEPINFDSYLMAPGRARINRTFANFQPRQTMAKEFILDNAADLAGRKLRVSLKEIQGTRVWNRIVTVP